MWQYIRLNVNMCWYNTVNQSRYIDFNWIIVSVSINTEWLSLLWLNCIEQNASWEADNRVAGQEVFPLLLNRHFHYCAHKNPQMVPVMSQFNPVPISFLFLCKVHFNIIVSSTPKSLMLAVCSIYRLLINMLLGMAMILTEAL
jgi:hypothetical protein